MGKTGLALFAVAALSTANAATVELISTAASTFRVAAQGSTRGPTYSPDGKFILLSSDAADIAPMPGNGFTQVYLLERATHYVTLVSAGQNGALGNRPSAGGQITADNRFVVFQSQASNLALGDDNSLIDVYLTDITTGTTTLVSKNYDGTGAGNAQSDLAEISPDGKWIVFQSSSTNIIAGDNNATDDLFAWNRIDGTMHLVTAGPTGSSTFAAPMNFSITPDGHQVLFAASGTNLVVTGKSSQGEVYLRDLEAETTSWLSSGITNYAAQGYTYSGNAVMSANGRYVFIIAAKPSNFSAGLFRLDLTNDSLVFIDVIDPGALTSEDFYGPSVTADGETAVYSRGSKIYVWRASDPTAVQLDVSDTQTIGGSSSAPVISPDGKFVVYSSLTNDIVAGVGNGANQLYLRDMQSGQARLITHSPAGAATFGNDPAEPVFSPDLTTIVFESESDELVVGDLNHRADAFEYKISDGTISLLSTTQVLAPSLTAVGTSNVGKDSVSDDGRFVLFRSLARLSLMDTNSSWDLYVFDRQLKTNILITAGTNGYTLPNVTFGTAILSRDGHKVFFQGPAGLATNSTTGGIYVRDLQTGQLENHGAGTLWAVSGDGQYMFFTAATELRRRKLQDRTDLAIAVPSPNRVTMVSVSENGRWIVYQTQANGGFLVRDFEALDVPAGTFGGSAYGTAMITLDGSTAINTRGSNFVTTNIITGETNSYGPFALGSKWSVSTNGQIIAFEAKSATFGGPTEIYLLDRATGEAKLISKAAGTNVSGNGNADSPVVSPDGRFVTFESWANDLVPGDNNKFKDIFVYDRERDKLTVATYSRDGVTTPNSMSINAVFSGDSSLLVFTSVASDLINEDLNDSADVFAVQLDRTPAMVDTDADGMEDAWELAAFGSLQAGASDDPDNDGSTNLGEFRAGTQPTSAESVFKIEKVELTGGFFSNLTFKAVAGRKYRLEYSLDLQFWTQQGSDFIANSSGDATIGIASIYGFFRLRLVE